MYKINGDNDELKELKESFKQFIEKRRERLLKGLPEELKKEILENYEKKDMEFVEMLKKRSQEGNEKYAVLTEAQLKKIDEELKEFEKGRPSVQEIIDAKMDKYIAECEKKWGLKFKK